jgi:hypothetical protein
MATIPVPGAKAFSLSSAPARMPPQNYGWKTKFSNGMDAAGPHFGRTTLRPTPQSEAKLTHIATKKFTAKASRTKGSKANKFLCPNPSTPLRPSFRTVTSYGAPTVPLLFAQHTPLRLLRYTAAFLGLPPCYYYSLNTLSRAILGGRAILGVRALWGVLPSSPSSPLRF